MLGFHAMADSSLQAQQFQLVLVEPSHPGNIGAVARAMDNFTLTKLALINPQNPLGEEALARACNGKEILRQARIFDDLAPAIENSQVVIGVTARRRSFLQEPLLLGELPQILTQLSAQGECSILFGNERTGLENRHLSYCTHLLTIPTNTDNPSLNLAQAALLVVWELTKNIQEKQLSFAKEVDIAISTEVEGLKVHLQNLLKEVGFYKSDEQQDSLNLSISDLVARAKLSSRDVSMLRGMIHRLELALKNK